MNEITDNQVIECLVKEKKIILKRLEAIDACLEVFGFDINIDKIIPSIFTIESVVCSYFNVPIDDLEKITRNRPIVNARVFCFFFIRKYHEWTLTKIGGRYNKHHATMIYYEKKASSKEDKEFDNHRKQIEKLLLP